jgi:hypothetical protein
MEGRLTRRHSMNAWTQYRRNALDLSTRAQQTEEACTAGVLSNLVTRLLRWPIDRPVLAPGDRVPNASSIQSAARDGGTELRRFRSTGA